MTVKLITFLNDKTFVQNVKFGSKLVVNLIMHECGSGQYFRLDIAKVLR